MRGVVTDVSSPESVEALAADVFATEGACHLLFNNAGVTSGGGGRPWEQEANDWSWCFSVNVFGVANGMLSFVPRMIESGQPGVVVNTSSMDGGIAPVPYASVYASSKAAISCLTEALAHQLIAAGTDVRAAVFYPPGACSTPGCGRRSATGPRNWPGPAPTAGAGDDLRGVQGAAGGSRAPGRASWTSASSAASASPASSGATSSSGTVSRSAPPCCTAGPTRSAGEAPAGAR